MASKIQLRRDSSGNWSATNPVLAEGEMGVELDTNRSKLGDGTSNWNDIDYMTDTNAVGTYDANYLIKNRDVGDQTVVSTGKTTFKGLVDLEKGAKLNDFRINSSPTLFNISNNINENAFLIKNDNGNVGIGSSPSDSRKLQVSNSGIANTVQFNLAVTGIAGAGTAPYNGPAGLSSVLSLNDSTPLDWVVGVRASSISTFSNITTVQNQVGFIATRQLANAVNNYGYYSEINAPSGVSGGGENFGFYGAGSAANFFAGDTYIGGTTSRSTRELWESTLTEEQKEQLAAGTLAIPANVSTPGDGSFVRQWWYNQQSAEDQALIDAGELEYPERYQAANFVDTFDLGEDTNINLLSTGRGEFKVIASDSDRNWNFEQLILKNGKNSNGAAPNVGKFFTKFATFGTTNDPENAAPDFSIVPGLGTLYDSADTSTATSVDLNASLVAFAPNGLALRSQAPTNQRDVFIARKDGNDVYAYFADYRSGDDDASNTHFNFYAAGNASNYFNGAVTGGGADGANAAWSIAANGTATGITVTRAAVVTDEQAGTVETLLDIITDLRARVTALEAGNGGY